MVTWFPVFQHLYDIFGSNCCQGDNSKGGLLYGNGMTGLGWGMKEFVFFFLAAASSGQREQTETWWQNG